MTIAERIKNIMADAPDLESDSLEKLVYLAYMMGRETGVQETAHLYSAHMQEQSQRAQACRYYKMAQKLLDNGNGYIYQADYRGDFGREFGGDETNF